MKARYGLSRLDSWRTRVAQLPPIQAGINTVCPRLESGNNSKKPWISPITIACRNVMW